MAQDKSSGDGADNAYSPRGHRDKKVCSDWTVCRSQQAKGFWVGGKGGDGALRIVETHERTASTRDGPPVSGTRSEMVEIGRAWKRERNSQVCLSGRGILDWL